jgi:hypothetical protein
MRQAAQQGGDRRLVALGLQHVARQAVPAGPGIRGIRHRAQRACEAQPQAGTNAGQPTQLGDAAVGHLAPAVHHRHTIDLAFEFGQRMRRQQHRRAGVAQFA